MYECINFSVSEYMLYISERALSVINVSAHIMFSFKVWLFGKSVYDYMRPYYAAYCYYL